MADDNRLDRIEKILLDLVRMQQAMLARQDGMDADLKAILARQDGMDADLKAILARQDGMDADLKAVLARQDILESRQAETDATVREIRETMARVLQMLARIDGRLDEQRATINALIPVRVAAVPPAA